MKNLPVKLRPSAGTENNKTIKVLRSSRWSGTGIQEAERIGAGEGARDEQAGSGTPNVTENGKNLKNFTYFAIEIEERGMNH